MTTDQFLDAFRSLLRMAFTSGLQALERLDVHPEQSSVAERRRFIAGCHRGYGKAQAFMITLLEDISTSTELSEAERSRCTVLVRGVAETIALSMLGQSAYMIRRLPLFDKPQKLDFSILRDTLNVAERLNGESRQTFALLTDLTISIHVADLLRVDFRKKGNPFELIELKSGVVNDLLQDALKNYPMNEAGLVAVDNDPVIDTRYRKQAKRMLRQKIRLTQVTEIQQTDAGVDIKYSRPIKLSSKAIVLTEYDDAIADLLSQARRNGSASETISHCIAIGVGNESLETSATLAQRALRQELGALDAWLGSIDPELVREVREVLGDVPPFSAFNLVETALGMVAVRPVTSWTISRDDIHRLISRDAVVMSAFHLAGFIRLARHVGIEMRFASRKETAKLLSTFGATELPRWNGRALLRGAPGSESPVTGGLLSRFLYNLAEPHSFLSQMIELETELNLMEPSENGGS
jgi:hypothetical protein